jgi:glucose/mannose transport system substrate-binding protein
MVGLADPRSILLSVKTGGGHVMTLRMSRARWALVPALAILATACSPAASQAPPASSAGGSAAPSAAGSAPAAGEVQKIEVFSWWTTGGEAAGLDKLIAQFNQENAGKYEVFNAAVAGGAGSNAQAVLATRMQSNDPPDSFQVHMGHELTDGYVASGQMEPLDDLYQANGWLEKFPKGVLDIVSSDGHYWSVPVNIHRANVLWYNKKVFTDNNLTPPTTWDEFKTVAEALKAKGLTPLAMGGKDNFEAQQVFETILIGTLGADGYKGLWTGTTDWAGADVTKAVETFKTVLAYTNTDSTSLTWDQANQMVIDGTAGMTIMGDWADGDYTAKKFTDYGWALAPGNDGIYDALSDTFGLPKGAKHPDGMKAFLTLLGSAEAQDIFNPLKGSIPARIDAGNPPAAEKQYDDYLKSALADWKVDSIVPSLEHGAAAKSSWKSAINDAVVLFQQSGDVAGFQGSLASACKDAAVCK